MDKDIKDNYESQSERAEKCKRWLALETTQEFMIHPINQMIEDQGTINTKELKKFDDSTFRTKIEIGEGVADVLRDYLAELESLVRTGTYAEEALKGENVDEY